MTLTHIRQLLAPSSVAVVGASNRRDRAGHAVMKNLLQGGFAGPIMPVTPKYEAVNGVFAYKTIESLPIAPDLAIICTRAERVPKIVEELGEKGCKSAIVIAAGLTGIVNEKGQSLQQQTKEIAKRWGVSLFGPHSLGIMVPEIGLNASYAHTTALPGKLAFVSQSAAVCATILDWAQPRGIGFSKFLSVGDAADIDFDELIDFLGQDPRTRAILLYIDVIRDGRRFMSAARAASFHKPIIVIKGGQTATGTEIVTHGSEDITCLDAVYDTAFRRAGMLRVSDFRDLFTAVEILAHSKPLNSEKLTLVANGIGPVALATDTLVQKGGRLTTLKKQTIEKLKEVIPQGGRYENPINLLGDAPPERYAEVIEILMQAEEVENLVILHSPSALRPSESYAEKVITTIKKVPEIRRPSVLVNWAGELAAHNARKKFNAANIPSFRTPEAVVTAFMHMVQYRRNQKQLLETPESIELNSQQDTGLAKDIVSVALDQGRTFLKPSACSELLKAYGIHSEITRIAETAEEAAREADAMGYPVALKILFKDMSSNANLGDVALNLSDQNDVLNNAKGMLERARKVYPDVEIDGFSLQSMARRPGAHHLRICVKNTPVFGPAIFLGESSRGWDLARSAVVALPPLNMALARYLVIQALAEGKIRERHLSEPLDRQALCYLLTQVSQLMVDNPHISELDINPILATKNDLIVMNCHIQISHEKNECAIRPYPKEFEEKYIMRNGEEILLRPIRPEDEKPHEKFDQSLTKEDRYQRYFGEVPLLDHEKLALMTQIDYDREIAFIATSNDFDGHPQTLGVVRAKMDPDNIEAEFAIITRSDMKGLGIGKKLMEKIIDYCRQQGTRILSGVTQTQNTGMAGLARRLGFTVKHDFEEGVISMRLDLQKPQKKNDSEEK